MHDIAREAGNTIVPKFQIALRVMVISAFFSKEWDIDTAKAVAEEIYSEYHWITMAELKLFEKRVINGHFGKQYNAFSPQILLQHLNDFTAELLEAREYHFGMSKKVALPPPAEENAKEYVSPERMSSAFRAISEGMEARAKEREAASEAAYQARRQALSAIRKAEREKLAAQRKQFTDAYRSQTGESYEQFNKNAWEAQQQEESIKTNP